MCGVLGIQLTPERVPAKSIKDMFDKQKTRGQNGFGIGVNKIVTGTDVEGKLTRHRTINEEAIFTSQLLQTKAPGWLVFHHRQPTSSPNMVPCNHPFVNEDKSIMLIHNGIISGGRQKIDSSHILESAVTEFFKLTNGEVYQKQGGVSVTDSEYALHFLEEVLEKENGDFDKALHKMGEEFDHSTFLILHKNVYGILFVSSGQQLTLERSSDGVPMLTSGGYKLQGDYGIFDGNRSFVWGSVSQRAGCKGGSYYSNRAATTDPKETEWIESTIPKHHSPKKVTKRSSSSNQPAGTEKEYYASITIPIAGQTEVEARATLGDLLGASYLELADNATIWEKGEQLAEESEPESTSESQKVEEVATASS